MATANTRTKLQVNNRTQFSDNYGHLEYVVERRGGNDVYFDRRGRRLGYIDSQGRTFSADNHLLNPESRPDLLLCPRRKG